MSNKHWRSSPNDNLLLSVFPEDAAAVGEHREPYGWSTSLMPDHSDNGGGIWKGLGRIAIDFVKGLGERAGEVLSESDFTNANNAYNQPDYNNLSWNQPNSFYEANITDSEWQGSPTIQATDSQPQNQFFQSEINRSPAEQETMGKRLEAIDQMMADNAAAYQAQAAQFSNLNPSNNIDFLKTSSPEIQRITRNQQATAQDLERRANELSGGQPYVEPYQNQQSIPLQMNFSDPAKAMNSAMMGRSTNQTGNLMPTWYQQNIAKNQQNVQSNDNQPVSYGQLFAQQNAMPTPRRFAFLNDWGKNRSNVPKIKLSPEEKERIRQQQEAERKAALAKRMKEAPEEFHNGVNIVDKVNNKKVLNDDELKQFFHYLNLKKLKAKTNYDKQLAENYSEKMKEKLAQNMVSGKGVIKHPDGYIVIGRQAYGTKEALQKARESIAYFEEHDTPLPPLPYPVSPNLKNVHYPDVTEKVEAILEFIDIEIDFIKSRIVPTMLEIWFKENFDNNKKWDLQVNFGLPGQVMLNHDPLVFSDQYAYFKGKIRRAGYISNYAFGYASAKAGYPLSSVLLLTQADLPLKNWVFKSPHRLKFDNEDDRRAIIDGWKSVEK